MSGHSKWSKIQHKKGAADAKRGAIFTKLGNAITVAAKQGGGDPDMNFSLRLAIDRAKGSNMPKDNIDRAIKRGTGEGGGNQLEEVLYEGFLPGQSLDGQKISILIECLTDNKNRTFSEIKNIIEKNGGSLAGPGAVSWAFEKMGRLSASAKATADKLQVSGREELELKLIDFDVENIEFDEDEVVLLTKTENFQKTKEGLEKQDIKLNSAELEFVAKDKVEISDEVGEKLGNIFDLLDENDDMTNYYTNIK